PPAMAVGPPVVPHLIGGSRSTRRAAPAGGAGPTCRIPPAMAVGPPVVPHPVGGTRSTRRTAP
ncbi:hypothetical protein ACWCQV_17210, partial [Streptomyces eurythermus]